MKKIAPRKAEKQTAEPEPEKLPEGFVKIGRCFFCLRDLMALQPGGLAPRHIDDQTPYCGERKS